MLYFSFSQLNQIGHNAGWIISWESMSGSMIRSHCVVIGMHVKVQVVVFFILTCVPTTLLSSVINLWFNSKPL